MLGFRRGSKISALRAAKNPRQLEEAVAGEHHSPILPMGWWGMGIASGQPARISDM
jgi:hypothetical protein